MTHPPLAVSLASLERRFKQMRRVTRFATAFSLDVKRRCPQQADMKKSKHVRAFSEGHLRAGESLAAWCEGYIGEVMGSGDKAQEYGALIVTGDRAVFYRKGLFGEVQESIPVKSITSIERRSVLGHRTLHLHTSHDQLVFKTMDKESEAACVEAIEIGRAMNSAATRRGNDSGLQARLQGSPVKPDRPENPEDTPKVEASVVTDFPSFEQDEDPTGNSGNLPRDAVEDVSVPENTGGPRVEILSPACASRDAAPRPGATVAVGKAILVFIVFLFMMVTAAASRSAGLLMGGGVALWAGLVLAKRTRRALVATLFRVPVQRRRLQILTALGELAVALLVVALAFGIEADAAKAREMARETKRALEQGALEASAKAIKLISDSRVDISRGNLDGAARRTAEARAILASYNYTDMPFKLVDPEGNLGRQIAEEEQDVDSLRNVARTLAEGNAVVANASRYVAKGDYMEADKILTAAISGLAINNRIAPLVQIAEVEELRATLDRTRGAIAVRLALQEDKVKVANEKLAAKAQQRAAAEEKRAARIADAVAAVAAKKKEREDKKAADLAGTAAIEDSLCGEQPVQWGDAYFGLEEWFKQVANDPDSVDFKACSQIVRKKPFTCWVTVCDVRAKNGFGALILRRIVFSKSARGWTAANP